MDQDPVATPTAGARPVARRRCRCRILLPARRRQAGWTEAAASLGEQTSVGQEAATKADLSFAYVTGGGKNIEAIDKALAESEKIINLL